MPRAELPGGYEGREQAYIKHRLLESYLQKLFLIVGMSAGKGRHAELCYIDCFAGPWGDPTEDMATTSIAISLDTLVACREKLGARGINAKIRALYVEEDPRAFARLEEYLSRRASARVETKAFLGDFVSLRSRILSWAGPDAFAFFSIDPKGWKEIGIPVVSVLLARPRSEFLITFMYNDINRTMSMADWQPAMLDLLGESVSLEGLQPSDRERKIVNTYRASCKSCMPAISGRSAYARIMDPTRERPKYHLVYLTSHPRGVVEFMTISQDVDVVQRQVRAQLKQERRAKRSGIADLFSDADLVSPAEGHAASKDVDAFWRDYLLAAGGSKAVDVDGFADILEKTDWFPDDLQSSLVRLIDAHKVRNLDARKRRPRQPLHYNMYGGETLRWNETR